MNTITPAPALPMINLNALQLNALRTSVQNNVMPSRATILDLIDLLAVQPETPAPLAIERQHAYVKGLREAKDTIWGHFVLTGKKSRDMAAAHDLVMGKTSIAYATLECMRRTARADEQEPAAQSAVVGPKSNDTAAVIEIDKVMLQAGAHWPDVETDAMVVRHVKQLTRMLNADTAKQTQLREQVSRAYQSGTDDFRRFYDTELFELIGVAGFQDLYAPAGSVPPPNLARKDEQLPVAASDLIRQGSTAAMKAIGNRASGPAKLQMNERGAWKDVIRFDLDEIVNKDGFLTGASSMLRNLERKTGATLRVVTDESLPKRLSHWDFQRGWQEDVTRAQGAAA